MVSDWLPKHYNFTSKNQQLQEIQVSLRDRQANINTYSSRSRKNRHLWINVLLSISPSDVCFSFHQLPCTGLWNIAVHICVEFKNWDEGILVDRTTMVFQVLDRRIICSFGGNNEAEYEPSFHAWLSHI